MTFFSGTVQTMWGTDTDGRCIRAQADHPFSGVAWTDMSGLTDAQIPPTPNVCLAAFDGVNDAQLAELQADTNLTVLTFAPKDTE